MDGFPTHTTRVGAVAFGSAPGSVECVIGDRQCHTTREAGRASVSHNLERHNIWDEMRKRRRGTTGSVMPFGAPVYLGIGERKDVHKTSACFLPSFATTTHTPCVELCRQRPHENSDPA
jgi:hypothetical protein